MYILHKRPDEVICGIFKIISSFVDKLGKHCVRLGLINNNTSVSSIASLLITAAAVRSPYVTSPVVT